MSPAEKMSAALAVVTSNGKAPPSPQASPTLEEQFARLQAENAALKARVAIKEIAKALTLKIGGSGCLVLQGLGRFPTSLYPSQWRRLLAFGKEIEAFIARNEKEFRGKDEDQEAYTARTGRKPQNKE